MSTTKIHAGDADLVKEYLLECCRKIAALVEGDFVDNIEIECEIGGKKYTLSFKETLNP